MQASAHKNRSAETKAAPSTPAKGRVEQRKARRSLSGASAKHCLYTCAPYGAQIGGFEGSSS